MTSRPILFSAPMALAILAGTKTQTRRAINPQPGDHITRLYNLDNSDFTARTDRWAMEYLNKGRPWTDGGKAGTIKCPYGTIGDQLWVRETWRTSSSLDHCKPSGLREGAPISYEADGRTNINNHERGPLIDPGRIRQSIYMRKWMSRITLTITDIRVQRLQDISMEDVKAEGISDIALLKGCLSPTWHHSDPYRTLWESINGPHSWQKNPYVWAITFDPFIQA